MNDTRGSTTLGELRGKLTMLEIACSKCDRRGLLRLDRLIAEHGARMGLPVLGQLLAADCPRSASVGIHDRCGVNFPQLPALFMQPRQPGTEHSAYRADADAYLFRRRIRPKVTSAVVKTASDVGSGTSNVSVPPTL
jgi:hypothetical protein